MSQFRLVTPDSELTVKIGERSWHVLDHEYFFNQGILLRQVFGMDFIKDLGKSPPDGKLKTVTVFEFKGVCETIWTYLLSHEDLLPYSYNYEFEKEKGRKGGGGTSGFRVRGYYGAIDVRPAGYCTLTLSEDAPHGTSRIVEIIDIRNKKKIETDDWGYLKIHRRKMEIDWYREIPRILDFLENTKSKNIEIYWD
jgi:hypothetical protein